MRTNGKVSALHGIFHQLCPRCRIGNIYPKSIFRGFPAMRERCPVCGLTFEREEGYFLGAMLVDYAIGIAIVTILGVLIWLVLRMSFEKTVFWAIVIFLPAVPTITRLGRVLWIYFDQSIDPDTARYVDQEHRR